MRTFHGKIALYYTLLEQQLISHAAKDLLCQYQTKNVCNLIFLLFCNLYPCYNFAHVVQLCTHVTLKVHFVFSQSEALNFILYC